MTLWIIPESDREGGQSVRSGSKVVYTIHYETPTDEIETFTAQESPWVPSGPTPTLRNVRCERPTKVPRT